MLKSLSIDMLATDIAEYLVRKGVSTNPHFSHPIKPTHPKIQKSNNPIIRKPKNPKSEKPEKPENPKLNNLNLITQVPFRETHHIAGKAVRLAEVKNTSMDKLTLDDFKTLHAAFDQDITSIWDFEKSIETRCTEGGTSRETVLLQVSQLKAILG
jgi:hypothetical protein